MKEHFKAKIYKTGINWCVDVPIKITEQMIADKGYIKIKGQINNFGLAKTLVPVKNAPYRLFVNLKMMKGGKTALGEVAGFDIEQENNKVVKEYPIPNLLIELLDKNKLTDDFKNLTSSRKKGILKYLSYIKTEEIMRKNIDNLVNQIKNKEKNVRIP